MNSPAGQGAARSRAGADRRHPARASAPSIASGDYMAPHRPLRSRGRPRAAGPAELLAANPARRTINEFDAKRLLDALRACRVTREQCGSDLAEAASSCPPDRISRRAQGRVGRHPAQDRAWPRRREPAQRPGARASLCELSRAARPARPAAGRLQVPGAGVRRGRRRGLCRRLARSRFRPLARLRHGRHRNRGDARFRLAHAAAARGRCRSHDRRDARRGACSAPCAASPPPM